MVVVVVVERKGGTRGVGYGMVVEVEFEIMVVGGCERVVGGCERVVGGCVMVVGEDERVDGCGMGVGVKMDGCELEEGGKKR